MILSARGKGRGAAGRPSPVEYDVDITYATHERARIVQQVYQYSFLVLPNQPKRLSTTLDDTQLITEFYVTNPSTVPPATAVSIFLGFTPNVTSTAGTVLGIEIVPGTTFHFLKRLYDTNIVVPSDPALMQRNGLKVVQTPIVVFDLTQMWVITGPNPISTTVVVTAFPQVYL